MILSIIFRPILLFTLVASFSIFFMSFFVVVGILTTRIQRNVIDRIDEVKNVSSYMTVTIGSLISGGIALVAMRFL